jgi:Ca2+-binding RTX toxin-like protein
MTGSPSVTVPGTGPNPVTVALGTGDVLQLASQIGALLSTISGSVNATATNVAVGSSIPGAPSLSPPTVTELVLGGTVAGVASVPSGYAYVVDVDTSANTVSGASVALVTATAGGAYFVTGQSTVAVEGSNTIVDATGTYLISTPTISGAASADTIVASGNGIIATDIGSNLVFASGSNLITSIGQDTIIAGTGATTVNASGSQAVIFGNSSNGALLFATVGGSSDIVANFNSDASIIVSGSNDQVFGGQALSNVVVSGSGATLVGGAGAETVSTSSNTLMFGGSGAISFVGGAGTSTIVGGSGGTEQVTVGAGGALFSAGANNNSTITGGAGTTTIFGGANSVVNFTSSLGGALFVGFGSNETLNAAGSSSSNVYSAGTGNVSIVGGSGNDLFLAGAGADTFTAGHGSNIFAFFAGSTGGHDVITDFQAGDALYLIGYASTGSASSLQNAATVDASGVTLTLSDSTKITFANLTNASSLNGDILYVPRTVA